MEIDEVSLMAVIEEYKKSNHGCRYSYTVNSVNESISEVHDDIYRILEILQYISLKMWKIKEKLDENKGE